MTANSSHFGHSELLSNYKQGRSFGFNPECSRHWSIFLAMHLSGICMVCCCLCFRITRLFFGKLIQQFLFLQLFSSLPILRYPDVRHEPRTSHLHHLAVPEESDLVLLAPRESLHESLRESLHESSQELQARPSPHRGSGLGGALSTFGAPAEWWHDSIILGRLSALALRYFASKATQKPWRHWAEGSPRCVTNGRSMEIL